MSSLKAKRSRRNLQSPRRAKANYLYEQVLALYEICPNTLTNWVQRGLYPYQSGRRRLFKGVHLNAFHQKRNDNAKRKTALDEVYCVTCKDIHSLLGADFKSEPFKGKISVTVPCPKKLSPAYKSMSIPDFEVLLELRKPIPERSEETNNDSGPRSRFVSEETFSEATPGTPPEAENQAGSTSWFEANQASARSKMKSDANVFPIYDYQMHVKEARGLHEKTVNAILHDIWQFINLAGDVDFREIGVEAISGYKAQLQGEGGSGEVRSAKTIVNAFAHLKDFFEWLPRQKGYQSIPAHLYEYFTPPNRLTNIARAPVPKTFPSPEDIRTVVEAMPSNTFLERRNRAMLAFTYLSGARGSALISFAIKHVDIDRRAVDQLARDVETKKSKTFRSDWFPVGDLYERIVIEWIDELKYQGADPDTPLFPRGPRYEFGHKAKQGWQRVKDKGLAGRIFEAAANDAGVNRFTPHRVRDTIAFAIPSWALSMEDYKALSQCFGHDDLKTTMDYYGAISEERQHQLISQMRNREEVRVGYDAAGLPPALRAQLEKTVEDFLSGVLVTLKSSSFVADT